MSYSITPILNGYKDKSGLQQVQLQVIFNRKKCFIGLPIKIETHQLKDKVVVSHPFKEKLNTIIASRSHEIEGKILDALKFSDSITRSELKDICRGNVKSKDYSVNGYFKELQAALNGKLSNGRLKHYEACRLKINEYNAVLTWRDIDDTFPDKIERFIRESGIKGNTIAANMSTIKAAFSRAEKEKLLVNNPFNNYNMPKVVSETQVYLTEKEVETVFTTVKNLDDAEKKTAGYYFLLSCYAGYRLSDCISFDYSKMVSDGQIVLRAKKNKSLVSIPVHAKLKPVLEFIRTNRLSITNYKLLSHVKSICKESGIEKPVKFHTARHSFAMLLMNNGFSEHEVADMLGDTPTIARTYAKISNAFLSKKILERLGS